MYHSAARRLAENTWDAFTIRERLIATSGCLACLLVFISLGIVLHLPVNPGFEGSILAGTSPAISSLYILISLAICSVIGAVLGGWLDFEGGSLCIVVGLAAASVRGGNMDYVLRYAPSSSVFLSLTCETMLLAGAVFGMRYLQSIIFGRIWPASVQNRKIMAAENEIVSPELTDLLKAFGAQVIATAIVEMLLVQTVGKSQVLPSVAIAAFLGTLLGYQIVPLANVSWYWIAPLIVGVAGYLAAYLSPMGWMIGDINGPVGALARPLPLDYASVGIAGTILGFWTARRWSLGEPE